MKDNIKTCSICGQEFPATIKFFHRLKNGLQAACKSCNIQRAAKWNKENLERRREIVMSSQRKHPETHKKSCSKYAKENPDQIRVQHARRRALKTAAEGNFSKEDIENLLIEQEGKCFYCSKYITNSYTVDHKIPLIRGGSNYKENLCLCCKHCNSTKHDKTDIEYFSFLGNLKEAD